MSSAAAARYAGRRRTAVVSPTECRLLLLRATQADGRRQTAVVSRQNVVCYCALRRQTADGRRRSSADRMSSAAVRYAGRRQTVVVSPTECRLLLCATQADGRRWSSADRMSSAAMRYAGRQQTGRRVAGRRQPTECRLLHAQADGRQTAGRPPAFGRLITQNFCRAFVCHAYSVVEGTSLRGRAETQRNKHKQIRIVKQ